MGTGWLAIFWISAVTFVALALVASWGGVSASERDLYEWIGRETSPATVAVFRWFNAFGNGWVLVPVALLLLLALPHVFRIRWWLWVTVMLDVALLGQLAKVLVGRPRPRGLSLGFPSGHTAAAAAFCVMVAYLGGKSLGRGAIRRLAWTCAALLVLLVGLARIVLHAHWPLDIAGGATLGLACAASVAWWNERHPERLTGSSLPQVRTRPVTRWLKGRGSEPASAR